MNQITTKIGITAIIGLVVVGNVVSVAYGQLSNLVQEGYEGTTYTAEDIATGKANNAMYTMTLPIISESMVPAFQVGQVALLNNSVPFEEIEEGDVIVFDCMEEVGKYVMHRVIDVDDFEDGSRAVETVGDNNDGNQLECEQKIGLSEYIGKIMNEEGVTA